MNKEEVERIRERLRKAVERRADESSRYAADPPPRYDEVWEKGLEWLERNG